MKNRQPVMGLLKKILPAVCFVIVSACIPLWAGPFSFSVSDAVVHSDRQSIMATLTWSVEPDHFLYRDRLGMKSGNIDVDVSWPPPKEKPDPLDGSLVQMYPVGTHEAGFRLIPLPQQQEIGIRVDYQGCSTSTCFMPSRFLATVAVPVGMNAIAPVKAVPPDEIKVPVTSPPPALPEGEAHASGVSTPSGETDFARVLREQGILWAMALAFLGGLLVSLTPCVYPMIPITLSIIGGRSENTGFGRGLLLSVTYVAGLSLTYALLGLLVAGFGAHIRGIIQGGAFQVVMAGIFALLALSMFDVFFLQVPSGLRNRLSGLQSSGTLGVFLIGMVSGLMASPCVAAPLAGILAFIASTGSHLLGFLMLLAFAWGMGIILIVVGTFSGSLNDLPRAGEWMNRIKEFYGFLLLGVSLYFARPVLGPEMSALGAALLLAALAGFLGVFAPVPAEAGLASRVLRCWGILALVAASGFVLSAMAQWNGLAWPSSEVRVVSGVKSLAWHDRIEDGLRKSAELRKPVFVDFRADWCTICLELEKHVFPDPQVQGLLEEMVLVKIDATTQTGPVAALLEKYKVIGLPTLIILDSQGNEIERLRTVGDIDAPALARKLKTALKK